MSTAQVQVGRIGRPHGIRGEVTVTPTTDDPQVRFAAGAVLSTEPAARGPLTVRGSRRSGPVFVVGFDGIDDRNAAERLRGTLLTLDIQALPPVEDDDEFYDHQLVGLTVLDGRAETRAESGDHARVNGKIGAVLGEVVDVLHPPAAPVLCVRRPDGTQELVPFVSAIVPTVDLAGGSIIVLPPDGMFG